MTYYHTMPDDISDVIIIDETTLQQAEAGQNYLNPDDFYFLGEFESIEDARDEYIQQELRSEIERMYDL